MTQNCFTGPLSQQEGLVEQFLCKLFAAGAIILALAVGYLLAPALPVLAFKIKKAAEKPLLPKIPVRFMKNR